MVSKKKTSKKVIKKKKEGFTLIELIATIAVLALVIGIAGASFVKVRESSLKKDYSNMISYIETQAANYAKKTGITTISVEELIAAGVITPTDETDLYNPITKKSINCYMVKTEYKDGEYVATFIEKDNRDENGKCNEYAKTFDYTICEYHEDGTCTDIIDNWYKDNITLAVRKGNNGEVIKNTEYSYDWLSSTGQTGKEATITTNINLASKSTYRVQVTMDSEIAEATTDILIDKEGPVITNVKVPEGWAKEKNVEIEVSDFNGSGVKGGYVSKEEKCPANENLYNLEVIDNKINYKATEEGKVYICIIDKVGNLLNNKNGNGGNGEAGTGKEIVIEGIDSEGATESDIELVTSTNEWVHELNIIGTAKDTKSGLIAYTFTESNAVPNNNEWIEIPNSPSNNEIRYEYKVTDNKTYYFWIKDAVGNISNKSITINNVDNEVDIVNVIKSTEDWTSNLNLTGNATDNKSGIVAYQFTTSTSEPNTWVSVSKTPSISNIVKGLSGAGSRGKYYFWVKDNLGNTDYKEIEVQNIGTYQTKNVTTGENRTTSTISYSSNISDIKHLVNVTTNEGSISSKSLNGTTVNITVTGGSTKTGTETLYNTIPAESYPTQNCYCPSGTTLSGGSCVGGTLGPYKGVAYTVKCNCPNGKWNCWDTPFHESGCPSGYSKDWYGNCTFSTSGTCSEGNYSNQCDYTCSYIPRSPSCSSGIGYSCSKGTLTSGNMCTYSYPNTYSYWQYNLTISYYI